MDAKEIAKMMKLCRELGVREFRNGSITMSFFPNGDSIRTHNRHTPVELPPITKDEEGKGLQKDELREKMDRLQNLPIENPVEYEKLITTGLLEENDQSGEEDDE